MIEDIIEEAVVEEVVEIAQEVPKLNGEFTLEPGEIHPMASYACSFIFDVKKKKRTWKELISGLLYSASKGDRNANICLGTLNRIEKDEQVEHTYVLGLAWYIFEWIGKDIHNKITSSVKAKKR